MIIAGYIAAALIGYLLGSIPFGLLISRRSVSIDVRQIGSGKTGATNVLRVAGRKAAVLVLFLDIIKGILAVVIARFIFGGDYAVVIGSGMWSPEAGAQALAGAAVMAGHIWPVFIKFKGGRGVATFYGGMLLMYWPAAVLGAAILIVVAGLTRYMSLGSIIGAVCASVMLIPFIFRGVPIEYLMYALTGAILIIIMHRDNIKRLISGTERKIGKKVEI